MNVLKSQRIPIAAINCGRSWSLHQDLSDDLDPQFIHSISQFGIIHPPILHPQKSGTFELICGASRFKGAVEILRQADMNCLLVNSSTPVTDLLQLLLEDQRLVSALSPIEKARFMKLCRQNLEDGASSEIERSCGLGSRRYNDRLLKLLELDMEVRSAIHRGLISEQIGLELLGCESKDRIFLPDLFNRLGLNRNKQRRLLEMGRVIMALEGNQTFMDIFRTHFPGYIDQAEISNPPQAAQLLLRDMQRLSNPMISRSEDQFKARISALGLPVSCTLTHSKSFEQDEVMLQIRFKDLEDFRQKWPKLKDPVGGE